jgi:hypothetical protein
MLRIVREHLKAKSKTDADFWSVAGTIELEAYQAIAARQLGARRARLERRYRDLHERAKSPRMWASVYDNAFLVLGSYARQGSPASEKERQAAGALLKQLREYAHPGDGR